MPGEWSLMMFFASTRNNFLSTAPKYFLFVLKFSLLFRRQLELSSKQLFPAFLSLMNSLYFMCIHSLEATARENRNLGEGLLWIFLEWNKIRIVCIIIHFWMIVITQKGYSTEQFMMMNKLVLQSSTSLTLVVNSTTFPTVLLSSWRILLARMTT